MLGGIVRKSIHGDMVLRLSRESNGRYREGSWSIEGGEREIMRKTILCRFFIIVGASIEGEDLSDLDRGNRYRDT